MHRTVRTLLIVDDSDEDRELYRRYLLRDGLRSIADQQEYAYTIVEASLGEEGLDLWQQHNPDGVLLDYRLPDMDGLEFLNRLLSATPESCVPVIVVTGQGNEAIAVQAIKAGAQDYLVKGQMTPAGLQLAVDGAIAAAQIRKHLQQRIEREQVVAHITRQIHQSLNLDDILQTTVAEVRRFLHTDRVVVLQLSPDGNSKVVAESVGAAWRSLLSATIYDPCLAESYLQFNCLASIPPDSAEDYSNRYCQGQVTAIADIESGSLDPCYLKLLASFQIKANLVVPILHDDQFWGLLIAHHCAAPRIWQPLEIDLLKELTTQVSIALRQAELYQQAQDELAERTQVELELRESEQRYATLAQISPVGIFRADANGDCQYTNARWCQLAGLTFEQAQGKGWLQALHPDDRDRVSAEWYRAAKLNLPFLSEYRFQTPEGIVSWVIGQATAEKDTQGRLLGYVGTLTDITERQQAEQERDRLLAQEQSARAEAEQSNRIKDEFLAVLSHELRSPLNPILGWAKLLQTRKFDETKTAQALATIERNAKLQTQLIDDLLDMAKIFGGKLSLDAVPVNLAEVIEAAIDTVRTAALAKSILLHPILPNIGQVSGDATRLQQIVWNLLSNAIKFTPQGGRVELRLEQVNDQAHIIVSDTGKGINPDFLPHIFESFRQEDVSITRKYGGLGLGLAIVRQLVEAHGGTIAASSPGEDLGATFTVRLPLLFGVESQPSGKVPPEALDLTGIRVLTVDDDPDARELLTAVLSQSGAEVLTVTSAAEVLTNLVSFQPDLLISDIGMPDVDGYTLMQQIRALPDDQGGQIPAIALTAYAREDDFRRAIASGYQRHITKPVDPEQLVQALVDLISL